MAACKALIHLEDASLDYLSVRMDKLQDECLIELLDIIKAVDRLFVLVNMLNGREDDRTRELYQSLKDNQEKQPDKFDRNKNIWKRNAAGRGYRTL